MPFENYSRVVLLTDRYAHEGVKRGDEGTIIEVYGGSTAYEVAFTNKSTGIDFARIVVHEDEISLIKTRQRS